MRMGTETESVLERRLYELEERLLLPEIRRTPNEVAKLLDDMFLEIGSSGQTYDKQSVIEALSTEERVRMSISEFRLLSLTPDLALVTYRVIAHSSAGGESHSLRSSLWRRVGGNWRMLFHQGTPTSAP